MTYNPDVVRDLIDLCLQKQTASGGEDECFSGEFMFGITIQCDSLPTRVVQFDVVSNLVRYDYIICLWGRDVKWGSGFCEV